jgi:LysM repeat protein
MRRFASWQIAGIVIILTLFSIGLSGCFQTVDASTTAVAPTPVPTQTLFIEPTTATAPTSVPLAPFQPPTQATTPAPQGVAIAQANDPNATATAEQATLFQQATDVLLTVTSIAANEQTQTATALGTFGPANQGNPQATAVPGQPTVPGINLGTAVPQGTPGAAGSGAAGPISANCIYTVVEGDRIYRIGLRFGLLPQTIANANGIVNVDLIVPGQQLRIPNCFGVPTPIPTATVGAGTPTPMPGTPVPSGRTYIVQDGDTLFAVATRFGVRVTALAQANNITNVNLIFIGQTLVIP